MWGWGLGITWLGVFLIIGTPTVGLIVGVILAVRYLHRRKGLSRKRSLGVVSISLLLMLTGVMIALNVTEDVLTSIIGNMPDSKQGDVYITIYAISVLTILAMGIVGGAVGYWLFSRKEKPASIREIMLTGTAQVLIIISVVSFSMALVIIGFLFWRNY